MIENISFPHALGPEKSILSSMLKDSMEMIGRAVESGLRSSDFYMPAHQTVFAEICKINDDGKAVDLVELTQTLLDRGLLDKIGGPSALVDLWSYAPHNGSFDRHLAVVKDKSILRSLISAGNAMIQNAVESPDGGLDALDAAESLVMGIRESNTTKQARTIEADLREIVAEMTMPMDADCLGIKTGFPVLDRMVNGGLHPGELFIIAARPSVGKTALMMNIVTNAAIHNGIPCGVFSLEMTQKQLLGRVIGSLSKSGGSIRNLVGEAKNGELKKIGRAIKGIKDAPLQIDDTPAISIANLRAVARRWKRQHGVKLLAIDYLQLMKSKTKQAEFSREREIAEISSGLKSLAKELSLPIIVLAQLNRQVENRTGKAKGKPRMSDLRESGAIEQDADLIGLLSREAYSAETEEEKISVGGAACLEIAKNRNGQTGPVWLNYIPEWTTFEPSERHYQPEPLKNRGKF